VFVELSNSEEIVQTPEDGLIALIDFQKSLGHLGLRLEKKLCKYWQAWNKAEYEFVDVNRVCPGVHKVRVGPATRSVVATCNSSYRYRVNCDA